MSTWWSTRVRKYLRNKMLLNLGETVWCEITSHEPLRFSMLELELFPGEMRTDKAAVFDRARQYASWKVQRGGDGTFHEFLGQTMLPQFLAPRILPDQKPELTNRISAYDDVETGQLLEAKVVEVTSSLVSMYVPSLDVYGRLQISRVSQSTTTTDQLFSTCTLGTKVLVLVAKDERKGTPGLEPLILFNTKDLEAEPGLVHKSLAEYNEKAPTVYMQRTSQWLSWLMDEAEQSLQLERRVRLPSLDGAVGRLFKCTVLSIQPYGAFVRLETGHVGMCHVSKMSQARIESVVAHLTLGSEVVMKLVGVDHERSRHTMSTWSLEAKPGEFLYAREAMMARARQAWEEQPPLPAAGPSTGQPKFFDKQAHRQAIVALLKVPALCMLGAARHTPEAREALRRYMELLERVVALPPVGTNGAAGLRIKLQALRAYQAGEWVSSQNTDLEQSLPSTREALGKALAALTNKSIPGTNPVVASNQVLKGLSDALLCLRVTDQTLHQQAVQAWLVACTPQIVQVLRSDMTAQRLLYSGLIQLLASNGWFAAYRQTDPVASQEMLQVLFDRLLKRLLPSQDAHPNDVQAADVPTVLYNIMALLNLSRMVGYQPTDNWWGLLFQYAASESPMIIKATDLDQQEAAILEDVEQEAAILEDVKTLAAAVCGARVPISV